MNMLSAAASGGSMADEVVQEACDKHGIMMLNTGFRMFYH